MSSQNDRSYLEEKLEASIKIDKQTIAFSFQIERIKLDNPAEISFLKEINQKIKKEINMMYDELSILHTIPNTFTLLPRMEQAEERDRLMISYKIVQQVELHSLTRIHLIVCPENIVLDQGLNPYFLHFGVKESLPPYEKNSENLFKEVKATVAAIADKQYSFQQYVNHYETLKLSNFIKRVFAAQSFAELLGIIEERIQQLNEEKSLLMTVNKKTWKLNRYVLYGVTICLIPALIYSFYSLFFLQPKQESFIYAQEKFLNNEFSEVVTALQPYEIDEMPKVTQYELSLSYIINESLAENQKEVIRNTVSLQSDPLYFEYWIHIGRGNAEEAVDIARFFEDRDLILYGLVKYKEQVKADDELNTDERQQLLAEIDGEIEEYEAEKEEEGLTSTEEETTSEQVQEKPQEQTEKASAPANTDAQKAATQAKQTTTTNEQGAKSPQ
ncbi:type VII secretion protein EssB [uncultured Metabacillus sp.]|uniref:type VII secretion protein EssB n=1 Tax=uncultured Metabacillus sp. TaxID=2860135 RepID=UPI002608A1BB|nr:type VII secretion protein EssB [uncultured Metabacillus sp.]